MIKNKDCLSIVLFVMLIIHFFNNHCLAAQDPNISQPIQATPAQTVTVLQPLTATTATTAASGEPVLVIGPDTTNYPEEVIGSYGNWIKKSEWYNQLKATILQISTTTKDIAESRQVFRQKYIGIGNQHADFFKKFGFEGGKIEELFAGLDRYLEKQRKRSVDEFTIKNRAGELKVRDMQTRIDLIDEKIKSYKVKLEQLKLDLQSIEELDKSLFDRLSKVDEQLELVNQDNAKVREMQKTMLYVVDHNKARDLYFKLKNEILAKLESIKTYLTQTLMQDFDTVSATINSQVKKTKDSIEELEAKGLIIKDRAHKISDIKAHNAKEIAKKQKTTEQKKPKIKDSSKKPSLLSQFYDMIVTIIAGIIESIKNIFYGAPAKQEVRITPITPAATPATPAQIALNL